MRVAPLCPRQCRTDELAARGGLASLLASGARYCEQVLLLSILQADGFHSAGSYSRPAGPRSVVHSSRLMYSQIFLRLGPLGLARVARATDGNA